jgi:hypothetical protein
MTTAPFQVVLIGTCGFDEEINDYLSILPTVGSWT